MEEGVPGTHPHTEFHRSGLQNVGLQPQKSRKSRNFWYKFAPNGKFWGSQKKLNVDAQLQTIMYAITS